MATYGNANFSCMVGSISRVHWNACGSTSNPDDRGTSRILVKEVLSVPLQTSKWDDGHIESGKAIMGSTIVFVSRIWYCVGRSHVSSSISCIFDNHLEIDTFLQVCVVASSHIYIMFWKTIRLKVPDLDITNKLEWKEWFIWAIKARWQRMELIPWPVQRSISRFNCVRVLVPARPIDSAEEDEHGKSRRDFECTPRATMATSVAKWSCKRNHRLGSSRVRSSRRGWDNIDAQ